MKAASLENDIRIKDVLRPSFKKYSSIAKNYTCDGDNINPTLTIHKMPSKAKSLVLFWTIHKQQIYAANTGCFGTSNRKQRL